MKLIKLATIVFCLLASPLWADSQTMYDTIKLRNGNVIYGKASVHPTLKNRIVVTFSNGGHMVLKMQEVERILRNTSAKDQFERRGKTEG